MNVFKPRKGSPCRYFSSKGGNAEVSEELENSLQQAVETYLNDRLRAIREEVSRLQNDVNEALARLRDNSSIRSLEGTALSAAIFAHLQTARGQRLTGVAAGAPALHDARAIKHAVEAIEQQQSQSEVLKSLLMGAAQFAERVALFVIKNDQAIGWRFCKASEPANLEMIGGVSLPLSEPTTVTRAANSRSFQSSEARLSEDHLLVDQLGGEPQTVAAVPLIVRGKVVAVLYADSASSEPGAINTHALEVLARVASMVVNLVSMQSAAAPAKKEEVAAPPAEPAVAPAAPVETQPTYTPEIEPQTAPEAAPAAPEVSAAQPTQLEAQPVTATPTETVPPAPETVVHEPPPQTLSTQAEQVTPPPSPPAFVSDYTTPLGGARRFGVSEPDLPIEVGEEERRLHNDARRFARLLVSEIKLYNEPKVKEGRNNGDLYDRLREDIDRSRQMYDKRVAPPVAARHDYFHQELVNLLAEGDMGKLGANYPGAAASS